MTGHANDNRAGAEPHPVLNYATFAGAVLVVAVGLMGMARAECNCNGSGGGGGDNGGSQSAGGDGVAQLTPEEKAKWDTVGAYEWSDQAPHLYRYEPDRYDTWGGRTDYSGNGGTAE